MKTYHSRALGQVTVPEKTLRRCQGCDDMQEGVAVYIALFTDGAPGWQTVYYCPGCYGLARANWNGETAAIRPVGEEIRRLEATAEHHRKMAHHYYTHNLESQRDAALEAAARADAEVARLRAEDA